MRYSTFFKFLAVVLCAASLLGMVGSAAGILCLTELGGKNVNEHYVDRLENQALSFGLMAAQTYASEELGGASRQLIDRYYGNNWESQYFNWARVGYTLYDGEGNAVLEQPIPNESLVVNHEFEFAVAGSPYLKVLSAMPYEEYYPQETISAQMEGTEVTVMPAQGGTAVHSIYVDYTDGSRQEWHYDGTQKGALEYNGGDTVTFFSNVGELPMGDGWYPNHIFFADSGGNIVYEAYDDTLVVQGSSLDGSTGMIQWILPAGTVTAAAPVGMTFTSGDYTSYDAIPLQGATVTSLNVSYGNREEGTIGSEGVSSPELIGTLFHDYQGNAEFHSNEPMTMEIPEGCVITGITFMDAHQNCLFEASSPGGVGILSNDENGYLVFRGQMPGTELPEETVPEEIVEATEAPGETDTVTGFAKEELYIYSAPSVESKVIGTVEPWQEIEIGKQDKFNGVLWGLVPGGWVLMEQVLVGESAGASAMARTVAGPEVADRNLYASPGTGSKILGTLEEGEQPEFVREDIFNGMRWGLTAEGWLLLGQAEEEAAVPDTMAETVPEATEEASAPAEEPEVQAAPEQADMKTEPVAAATEVLTTEPMGHGYPEEEIDRFPYYDGQEMIAEYVTESIPDGYTIRIRLAKGAMRDEFAWTLLRLAEAFRQILLEVLGICIVVFALCVVHLSCSAGRTRRDNTVRAGGLNRIPLDLYLAGGGCAEMGLVAAAIYGSQYFARSDEQLAIIFCGGCAYLACLLLVGFFFAFVAQIKTPGGYWWRNTFCGWCIRFSILACTGLFDFGIKAWRKGTPVVKKVCLSCWHAAQKSVLWLWDTGKRLLFWAMDMLKRCFRWTTGKLARFFGLLPITWQFLMTGFTLVFLLYVMMRTYKVGYILLGFGIFFAVILYAASAFAILLESAKRMSKGDLDTKVDDRMLIGGFKEFSEKLNDLAGVAVIAAQKQLKSERMKTELITNVSHDIKTPLTSIINYVDLLQKPHTQVQQEQYLEVLDRQSQRLKKLIDDLMEMSKASTGNLAVDIAQVDAAEAVNQALGEFADKLERAQLMPVFRQPEEQVYMMADGRLVWRVMSNILGNAVKYALPGTRLYIDLLEMDGKVIISMKNISREELNVNADELMERFVRGDASRNTEGSGLGLNIAQSLMELQKGQLQILVDGDLFKVTLIFPGL